MVGNDKVKSFDYRKRKRDALPTSKSCSVSSLRANCEKIIVIILGVAPAPLKMPNKEVHT